MAKGKRAPRVTLGAEIALAFVASGASFALVAVTVAALDSDVLAALVAVAYLGAVIAMARFWGAAYAIGAAMAGLLAYDWFYLPPTHPLELPEAANLVELPVFLGVAVLVGELATLSARRADASDEARGELAEEQAALRRVATLVAGGVSPDALFAAVGEEVGVLLGVDGARIVRYEGSDEVEQLVGWTSSGHDPPPLGRVTLEGTSVTSEVLRTGRAVRIDDYASVNRVIPWPIRTLGIQSAVGAPIVVDGRLWGAMVAWSLQSQPLAETAESRLAGFTELVATAISNTASREERARLADEQAALRRVAMLVARGVAPPEVFTAVVREVGQLLTVDGTHLGQYDADGATTIASWTRAGAEVPVGARSPLDGESVTALVAETGRPARMNTYEGAYGSVAARLRALGIRSSVGAPIIVEGRLWGVMIASSTDPEPLPSDTESRIAAFTDLVATAISNTDARTEVARLAEEQAALRRVATLVARESSPAAIFAAVAEEVARLLRVEGTRMLRYEADGTATVVADWGDPQAAIAAGTRLRLDGENVSTLVRETEQPVRIDDYAAATGSLASLGRKLGIHSAVGCPIVVHGRVWGAMIAAARDAETLPVGIESRIGEFTELVATAISNIQARTELAASRARIVAATDATRRRFERDLHDGTQQRLVSLTLELRTAETLAPPERDDLRTQLSRVGAGLVGVLDELRELSRGIHPAILSEGGLGPALRALARRSPVPVALEAHVDERFDERVEVAAYYVVSEALANVAKHAEASVAEVHVGTHDGVLDLTIRDDGVGGADPATGSGLTGLTDRVEALDGRIEIVSRGREGTSLRVELPATPR